MEQYNVTGMSCAACSARVEKAVSAVPGVTSVSVSLLTNAMGVEGTASPDSIIKAVENAGYGASRKGAEQSAPLSGDEAALDDKETPILIRRLLWSLGFLVALMYLSMGHMMLGWPLPAFYDGNHVAMGLTELLLAVIIMVINQKFFVSGFRSVLHGAPNMDTLVAMGSGAAFVYSAFALFAMTDAQVKGGSDAAQPWMMEFYFESAAMILTLITVGKTLEARSKGRTTDALKSLMRLAPQTAVVIRNGVETEIPMEQVQVGDIFVVRPGEHIPVDGIVIEGGGAVDEAALTGESVPVDKAPGDTVSAATVNRSGFLKCRAVRVGQDTTLSQIIKMVSDAAATKAPIARIADKVSGVFVPTVIAIAAVTTAVWLILRGDAGFALARGISVLVISCPCALGLATPVAIMVGNGMGAKNGILFKTAAALESAGRVEIVALDKTGTVTQGEPHVTDLLAADGADKNELLRVAAALEQYSEHPLSKAVLEEAKRRGIALPEASDFEAIAGKGLSASLDGAILKGGNADFVAVSDASLLRSAEAFAADGKTPLYFSRDGKAVGVIAVADVIKPDSPQAVKELQGMGIQVVMLTGDNRRVAEAIGKRVGVDETIAEVLPDGKEQAIRRLKERGRVAMVGDGINDAPALTRADTGIAIGAGTDVAIDAADIVLMKNSLMDVPAAIRLSRATLRNIHQNLFWAFFYNAIGIPLAAGVFIPLGVTLHPMFGAAAMSLSSFCVVSNALRLNLFDLRDSRHDKKRSGNASKQSGERSPKEESQSGEVSPQQEEKTMEKTMKIEGMMCEHCEARVKKALEALPEVEKASVSRESGAAVVTLSAPVDDDALKNAVEAQDYKVLGIQ